MAIPLLSLLLPIHVLKSHPAFATSLAHPVLGAYPSGEGSSRVVKQEWSVLKDVVRC